MCRTPTWNPVTFYVRLARGVGRTGHYFCETCGPAMLRLAVESGGWPGRGRLHAEVTAVEMIPSAAWFRVSTGHQETANQAPDVEQFALHHGYEIDPRYRYTITDTAWKNGGGREYKEAFRRALTDAHAGKFKILIVWALDRIVRDEDGGAEAALRIMRQFRQAGVMVVSVREPWLNGSREVQDVLVAFAGWMAGRESARRSDRIKNGLARRRAEGKPVGRQRGAVDKKQRRRAGYVASWEDGPRRAAQQARTEEAPS